MADEPPKGEAPQSEPPQSEPPKEASQSGPLRDTADTDTMVAILLAVAAVLAAAIGVRAAVVGDDGSDTWHRTIRQDVKRSAGVVEDINFTYNEEAPAALQIAEARIRGRELRRAARTGGGVRGFLQAEAAAQERLMETNTKASAIASEPKKYATKDGGYDIVARLADRRAEHPDLVRIDPDGLEKRGADRTKKSALLVAATILVGFAFLLGALAEGFARWRRRLLPAGFVFAGLGLITAVIVEVSV